MPPLSSREGWSRSKRWVFCCELLCNADPCPTGWRPEQQLPRLSERPAPEGRGRWRLSLRRLWLWLSVQPWRGGGHLQVEDLLDVLVPWQQQDQEEDALQLKFRHPQARWEQRLKKSGRTKKSHVMFYSLRGSAQGGAGKWQKRMRAGADVQQPNNLIQSTFESTIIDVLFFRERWRRFWGRPTGTSDLWAFVWLIKFCDIWWWYWATMAFLPSEPCQCVLSQKNKFPTSKCWTNGKWTTQRSNVRYKTRAWHMSHVVLFEIDFLQTSPLTSMYARFDTDVEEEMPKKWRWLLLSHMIITSSNF